MSRRRSWLALAFALFVAATAVAGEAGNGVKAMRDLAYGPHRLQKIDVYLPAQPKGPVLLYVHGGAWSNGDKSQPAGIRPKVDYWTAQGYVVVSANYRLAPEVKPTEQADDLARALAFTQREAAAWGADGKRVVLLGHSAGAHLVALLTADPARAQRQGAGPWRVSVSLDNSAFDVVSLMQAPHARAYDRAFGKDPALWKAASPFHVVQKVAPAIMMICRKGTDACTQALAYERKAAKFGHVIVIWESDKSHAEIDRHLGAPGYYTDSIARWISSIL